MLSGLIRFGTVPRSRGGLAASGGPLATVAALALVVLAASVGGEERARRVALGDWPEMRGPSRDGIVEGDGPARQVGASTARTSSGARRTAGRSSPIVMGDRVYVQNPSGRGAELQERVMALDANSGKLRVGVPVQPLSERRADAPRRLGVAGGRPGDRQHLRAGRQRLGRRAEPRRQARSGSGRSARSSRRSRRTAAGRPRRSSTATS